MRNSFTIGPTVSAAAPLVAGTLLALLAAACGGGYGGSSASGGGGGCGGAYGGGNCAAPTVTVASPGATVDRTVTLSATASAASGLKVSSVDFLVDSASVGKASSSPYTVSWDSTTVGDGSHVLTAVVTDSQNKSTTSAPVDFKVDNNPSFPVTLAAAQIIPAPASLAGAAGTAALAVKLATGAVSGKVTLSGFTATGVTLNEAFAGNSGATLVTLTPSAGTAGEWDVPGSALLTSDQMTALLTGKLYVIASSAANPGGELRGQLTPANVTVIFAQLSGAQEVPAVNTNATGIAAVTVDANANTVTVHLHTSNASDATSAAVDTGAAGATGAQLVALAQDNVDPGHWSVELAAISTSDVGNFNANKWYLNVVTPADPKGAIRGQVDATSTPPPPAPTLTQLTTTVFQVCGGCHTGGGQSLPSSMDLTPGHIYASLVNVASVEVPSLDRVKPGDATNSYVVQKLAGTAAVGSRMPLGGPYLSQSDMDQLKAWISAGAANN